MPLLDDLAAGTLGLVVKPPSHLAVSDHTATSVKFADPEHGLGWWFLWFPHIHLDLAPQHAHELERDLRRHTRLLFDTMFAFTVQALKLPSSERPRTHDASWDPLIEYRCEGPALTILHRMHYQPARESVMGHTLVPVEGGLFEARWLAMAQMTGYRESVLMLSSDNQQFLPQSAYDDVAHDEKFPQHPLSLARAAARWHDGADWKITNPQQPSTDGEITLDPLQCAVRTPPRFLAAGTTGTSCVLTRASFSGSDGVDRLTVKRTTERIRGIAVGHRLAKLAETSARTDYTGLANVTCRAASADGDVQVVAEGDPQQVGAGRARTVWRWFLDDDSYVWWIALSTTVAVPLDELVEDVAKIRRSWRRC
jgi:hypothetical protein